MLVDGVRGLMTLAETYMLFWAYHTFGHDYRETFRISQRSLDIGIYDVFYERATRIHDDMIHWQPRDIDSLIWGDPSNYVDPRLMEGANRIRFLDTKRDGLRESVFPRGMSTTVANIMERAALKYQYNCHRELIAWSRRWQGEILVLDDLIEA